MKIIFLILIILITPFSLSWAQTVQGNSLYDYQTILTDQDGKQMDFNVFQGHPVVVSMFYASCDYSCPLFIDVLKKMDSKLDSKIRDKIRILLISFDPAHDTSVVLYKLAKQHHLDLSRWKLVFPSKNHVRDLAALLNYTYRPLPDGGFNHTSAITLLDERGVILHSEEGLQNAANSIVEILKKQNFPFMKGTL
ncbi:MAG: hypothetical protein A3G32_03645 [Deltaproteobacteria bacterium RIFCSPLOWO2_12_FULL_40_28]|nr:MAG: hypothetical protein A3C45_05530 [Deltaproteobacteria bacterium RIFCSPHIGHO2_02_FULL_40_28]OGQ19416.1 MAG: hypothetical protein A3E27_06160 [Deltaproteobacteria bacterium RIFCSPHIGHO2_12_FULL_40_32]OGQ39860.1 MAG: hypothetical protein A3I69_07125 [Deltaproteobacteria bacterium RIFCSPLOWO2_02_FULL_40_36]OGQ53854.1 MAG: hypothetical protein A3G32_03645 [Deltaproteobacteria bacterium RIFCSPLOWO2_12_FULL_40_28]